MGRDKLKQQESLEYFIRNLFDEQFGWIIEQQIIKSDYGFTWDALKRGMIDDAEREKKTSSDVLDRSIESNLKQAASRILSCDEFLDYIETTDWDNNLNIDQTSTFYYDSSATEFANKHLLQPLQRYLSENELEAIKLLFETTVKNSDNIYQNKADSWTKESVVKKNGNKWKLITCKITIYSKTVTQALFFQSSQTCVKVRYQDKTLENREELLAFVKTGISKLAEQRISVNENKLAIADNNNGNELQMEGN